MLRAAYRSSRMTATTSSRGPITGRNSGSRSIGETTHTTATSRATLARRGTAGSLRRVRAVVTHDGRNSATCRISPGGRRWARSIITTQAIAQSPTSTPAITSALVMRQA